MSMTLLNVRLSKYNNNNICNKKKVSVYSFETPIGEVYGVADEDFLYLLSFEDSSNFEKYLCTLCKKLSCTFQEEKNKILKQLEDELEAYFKGKLKQFTIPIKAFGSDFQQSVWDKLRELPYGSPETYGGLAKALGKTSSYARAVGAVCGANVHLFIVPCHRVVSSNSVGGFSCGKSRKDWLLEHEKKHA